MSFRFTPKDTGYVKYHVDDLGEVVPLVIEGELHDCEVLVIGLEAVEKSLEILTASGLVAGIEVAGHQPEIVVLNHLYTCILWVVVRQCRTG